MFENGHPFVESIIARRVYDVDIPKHSLGDELVAVYIVQKRDMVFYYPEHPLMQVLNSLFFKLSSQENFE